MSDIKLRFSFDGKDYEAEPAPYVKAAGVQLKVIKSDEGGRAEVKPDGKRGVSVSEAVEVVKAEAESEKAVEAPTGLAALSQAALVAEWEKRNTENVDAQAVAKRTETSLQEVEAVIAARLVAAGKNAIATLPGGVKVKARSTKEGPRLARFEHREVSLDAPTAN